MTGETIDLSKTMASTDSKSLKHLTEVVEEDGPRGTLEETTYAQNVTEIERTLSSGRPGPQTNRRLRYALATTAAIVGGSTSNYAGSGPIIIKSRRQLRIKSGWTLAKNYC